MEPHPAVALSPPAVRTRIPLFFLLLATACGGGGTLSGGGSGGGGTVVTPTPTPTTPAPTPTPPATAEPATGADFFSSIALLYAVQPDITACQPGTLRPEVGARVLATLNEIRALHRLPPVAYASADEAAEQQSALMMAANGQLSHNPPTSWNCYTAAGANGAASSNIFLGIGSGLRYNRDADLVAGWLTDVDNLVMDSVGHRRWLLYPFLSTIAYGRVAGRYQTSNRADAASIRVINTAQAVPASLPEFVAYPFEDYPARYYAAGALLSFGVIADPRSNFGANSRVNFSAATVTVRARGGAALTVSRQRSDNDGFGLSNNLQWAVAGLQNNIVYDVSIANVNVNGTVRSYSYFFRIVP